jgi:hypothetical protein
MCIKSAENSHDTHFKIHLGDFYIFLYNYLVLITVILI